MSFVFSLWFLSFLAAFFIFNRQIMEKLSHTNNDIYWTNEIKAFMPIPPVSLADVQWYIDVLFKMFDNPGGFTLTGIAALAFLTGCISVFSKHKETFFILISPIFITLFVSIFHVYPFAERTILFLVPMLLFLIAEGALEVRDKTRQSAPIIGIALIVFLFLHPLAWSAYHVVKPPAPVKIKPVLTHIKKNWQEGDIIYVYYMAYYAFEYYSNYHPGDFHFDKDEYIIGRAHTDWYANYKQDEFKGFWSEEKKFSQPYILIFREYVKNLNKLRGRKRVWFLFSSYNPTGGIYEENFLVYHLDTIGKQLDYFGYKRRSSVYLYDLSDRDSSDSKP